jgi:hypothetical protein
MASDSVRIDVYVERGKKKTFAGAIDWPGWCRAGRDEASALQALFDYGPRYARALRSARLDFSAPADRAAFVVVERCEGTMTTDYGAPDIAPASDARPVSAADLERLEAVLKACWRALDTASRSAANKSLRKGPRGGGRELHQIVDHVAGADAAYLSRLGWKLKVDEADDAAQRLRQIRQAILDGLAAAAAGKLPERGPRGGRIWSARYYVRRSAWHVLDHAWEIEDRAT